jgi:ATP-dependent Clp protease adaptor protein ClpS
MADPKHSTGGEVLEKPAPRLKEPALYQVILHNDDYTTMEFVVEVLETVFNKGPAEAHGIMMRVHIEGHGVAGIYPHEVAETKVDKVHEMARTNGFPLRASLEEA